MPLVSHSNVSACHVSVLDRGVCWISRKTAKKTVLISIVRTSAGSSIQQVYYIILLHSKKMMAQDMLTTLYRGSMISIYTRTYLHMYIYIHTSTWHQLDPHKVLLIPAMRITNSSPLLPSAELLLMVTAPLLVFRGPVCLLYASVHRNQRVKNGGINQPSCGNETTKKGRAQHGLTNNHSHSTEQNIVFCVLI